MSTTSRVKQVAAALAAGTLVVLAPTGGTAAWADEESPAPASHRHTGAALPPRHR
ncbi:hypothetical protein [Nocardioides pyridinolyticus]